jgi:hypothetical protein
VLRGPHGLELSNSLPELVVGEAQIRVVDHLDHDLVWPPLAAAHCHRTPSGEYLIALVARVGRRSGSPVIGEVRQIHLAPVDLELANLDTGDQQRVVGPPGGFAPVNRRQMFDQNPLVWLPASSEERGSAMTPYIQDVYCRDCKTQLTIAAIRDDCRTRATR